LTTGTELDLFLNKHTKNIYISQGTITKALRVDQLADVLAAFPDYGFILSLKKHFHTSDLEQLKNVYLAEWVPQNDLLGDERVVAFVTHGGINSLLESIYHAKPMVVIGTSIDQVNGAVLANSRKIGIGITREEQITVKKLIESISAVVSDKIYKENVKSASGLVKDKDGKETFYFWLNYIMEFGYEHLLVPAYSHYSFIELYNIDLWILFTVFFSFVVYLLFKITRYALHSIKKSVLKNIF
jgi:UDP:flavonoid glycosyltransferase YjiC (YdhE family)